MYKALIVDDEKEIREGLRTVFPWDELGVDEVMTAEDGESALRIALEYRPDVIITDIKMGKVSGIQFLQRLKSEGVAIDKSIVISGYDDFEFVKQALQLGVMDYVLKPIDTDELKKLVLRAFDRIRSEVIDRNNQEFLQKNVRRAIPRIQEELLRELADRDEEIRIEPRLIHRLNSLKLEWLLQGSLIVLALEVDDLKAIEQTKRFRKEKELILFAISNVVSQTLDEAYSDKYALFQDLKDRWIIFIPCPANDSLSACGALAEILIARINQYVKVNISIGMSSEPGGIAKLSSGYQESIEALEGKAVIGGNRLLVAGVHPDEAEESQVHLNDVSAMIDLLRYGTTEEILETAATFPELVRLWAYTNIRDIQQKTFEWILDIFKRAATVGYKDCWWEQNILAVWDRLEKYDTLESLQKQTEKYLLELSKGFHKLPQQNQILSEAEKIMKQSYMDALTLQFVADRVHVTPVWLSKLFKKEKNTTFLDELTEIRMAQAKEMLHDVGLRIYQIANNVGYRNPNHFAKLFKKVYGSLPMEYRNSRGIRDE